MAKAKKSAEQAPVEKQTASQPTPQPTPQSTGGNKNVGMIVGVILVLVAGVAGWGYWNGSQVKAYAEKAEGYMDNVGSWSFNAYDADDAEDAKADVDAIVSELEGKKAPAKAKQLETDLKEYFGMAQDIVELFDVFAAYEEAGAAITDVGTDLYDVDYEDPSNVADAMKETQKELEEQIETLEALTVPEDLKSYHDSMIKMYKDMADAFDGLIDASEAGDINEFLEATDDFQDVAYVMYDMDDPQDALSDYEDYEDKFDDLEDSIEKEISSLKGTTFVLF